MITYKSTIPLLLVFISISFVRSYAATGVEVDQLLLKNKLGCNYQYIEDKNKSFTIENLTHPITGNTYHWQKANQNIFNRGYTRSAYWISFTLKNSTKRDRTIFFEVAYPLLGNVFLYIPQLGGSYNIIKTGTQYPFSQRPLEYRTFVFPLVIAAGNSNVYYLRVDSEGTLNVPLGLYTPEEFIKKEKIETTILWMFYGIMFIMAIYNLLIFIYIREISYAYYVLFITCLTLGMMSINGHLFQYIWPNINQLNNYDRPIILGLYLASMLQFTRHFIQIREYSRIIDAQFNVFAVLSLAAMPISIIINNYHFSMLGLLILNSLALLVLPIEIIYITIKSRIREAVILTISFSLLLWGSLTYLMKSLGIIEENVITKYSMYLGSIAHVLLLSFGLTDKIKTLRDELQHLNVRLSKLDTDGKKRIISYANREKLKKAIIYIEENYHDDITREGLASFIEMNCDDFGRYFKLYTGMKINEYIYELRINEAARRIRETDESITEISFSVGFESFNTFKRAFYKIQNLSPIKYKKLHIADNKHDDLETKEPPQPVP